MFSLLGATHAGLVSLATTLPRRPALHPATGPVGRPPALRPGANGPRQGGAIMEPGMGPQFEEPLEVITVAWLAVGLLSLAGLFVVWWTRE